MDMSLNSRLAYVFYFWFALLMSWLFLNVIFDNSIYSFKVLPIITLVFLWALLTGFIYGKIDKLQQLAAHPKIFALFILASASVVQFYCANELAIGTGGDVEAVFKGAINLATQSNLLNYTDYFQLFPHNLGGTLLLSYVFKLGALFGYYDYYTMGIALNTFCVDVGFYLVFVICYQLKGYRSAFLALWLCLSCLPIYLYIPIFYTDIFSLPFIPVLYYLYLYSARCKNIKQWLMCSVFFGFMCAVGSLIKFTVVIIALAIALDLLIRKKIIHYLLPIICVLLTYKAVVISFNAYIYHSVLNERIVERTRVPYTHWVMMGLAENGAYNGYDYEYTYSFTDPDARVNANINRIKERLSQYGLWGYMEFATRKEILNFGSGMYGVYEMLDDNPLKQSELHDFVIEGGKYFFVFKNITQGFHVFLFFLIVFSLYYDLFFKTEKVSVAFMPRLAMSGIFVFLLLWEACPRYIINYIPIFIVCAALSYGDLFVFFRSFKSTVFDAIQSRHKVNELEADTFNVDKQA